MGYERNQELAQGKTPPGGGGGRRERRNGLKQKEQCVNVVRNGHTGQGGRAGAAH